MSETPAPAVSETAKTAVSETAETAEILAVVVGKYDCGYSRTSGNGRTMWTFSRDQDMVVGQADTNLAAIRLAAAKAHRLWGPADDAA